jgi:GDP-L-fucose synthase
MLEIHCKSYRDNYGSNFTCIIPTNIYGAHDNYDLENGHVIPSLIHKCFISKKEQKDFIIKGTGKPLRQFIYSEDLAKLILTILEKNINENIILSVPESSEISIGDVGKIIAKCFDYEDRVVFDEKYSDGQYKKTADNSKLLKWNPNFSFTDIGEGINVSVKWFCENYELAKK